MVNIEKWKLYDLEYNTYNNNNIQNKSNKSRKYSSKNK